MRDGLKGGMQTKLNVQIRLLVKAGEVKRGRQLFQKAFFASFDQDHRVVGQEITAQDVLE